MTDRALDYIDQNKERFIEELKEFLRFPSVTKPREHRRDVIACARWLREHLAGLGLEAVLIETDGNPIVRALARGRSSRRLLIYGHYDVQPVAPLVEWVSPPFEPEVRDGFIYGRGSTDDKGQLFAHIKGIESLLKTGGELPCEVLFLIEGDEEGGADTLSDYVRREAANLQAEAVVISDSSMYDERTPTLIYGLRGLVGLEVLVKGPRRDVHSGSFGGAVPNPAVALAHILARCIGLDGRVLIPGFYDDVRPLAEWEREHFQRLQYDEAALVQELGLKRLHGEAGFSPLERIGARPTFEVNGLYGGYMGEGGKTIIPASAGAKLTMRLVPDQDWRKVAQAAVEHLRAVCPEFVELELSSPSGSNPVLINTDAPLFKVAAAALKQSFGAEPVLVREGGSIPVVETFWQELHAPVLLMGFGLNTDGAHSPNERFKLDSFIRGVKTSTSFLSAIE